MREERERAGEDARDGDGVPGRGPDWRVFLRSFLLQGSWNYRTMQGTGFGFSVLPVLRTLHPDRPKELSMAVARHVEHFNAHPYLAELALGAVLRMESDGEAPEAIHRFKSAVRGPLGQLGDSLVWGAWLPSCVLLAVLAALLGTPPLVVVVLFLVTYNGGHLWLRVWAFRTGFREGREVAGRLRSAALLVQSGRVAAVGSVLLGAVAGVLLMAGVGGGVPPAWVFPAALLLLVGGAVRGLEVWRPAWYGLILILLILLIAGTVT